MHCHQVQQLLVDYLDGELDIQTGRELEEHLKDCVPCEKFIKTYRATIQLTKKVDPGEMPDELKERLQSFIKAKLSPKSAD